MKIVYFGTPLFAAEVLQYLLEHDIELAAVVTQPDRPKGRSLQWTPSPVKLLTLEKRVGVPVFQPEKASDPDFLKALAAQKADLFVVVVYGQILPQRLLDIPPLGCINIHPSLLPKYRGAAPIQRALMAGETETGVVIQKMVYRLDAGDVLAVAKTAIPPEMIFGELEHKLLTLAKPLLLHVLRAYEKGIPPSYPQDHAAATYAAKFTPEEGEIHWEKPAQELHNLIRAFSPRPGAWCWVHVGGEKKRLKILRSAVVQRNGKPGQFLADATVACGENALQLIDVQPEGKKAMKAADWLRGQKNISFN